ncbi:hypothetical protein BT67DRAFT_119307 [Trichocladium antarcticum]|uniref:non-specific serine/threonine protein kinase n=1 Tax=Trichocladium antarcticum TaxID=1450529 RepID=A0AAN6URY4_9PEZI|nr:hypothetical protein BT67DRAFT_119307 [Trichocladium antarcticum]
MADQPRSKIIKDSPIGKGLDNFRASFNAVCIDRGIPCTLDALVQLGQEDIQGLASILLSTLQLLPVTRRLPSNTGRGTLQNSLLRLISTAASDDFDLDRIKPVLKAALANVLNDALVWDRVYDAVTESTPRRPIASSLQQTPWLQNTSGFANSSEYRHDVDKVLRAELGPLYVGLHRFHETYFGGVVGLEAASKAVFRRCTEGSNPLFREGWSGWPKDANLDDVLDWFADLSEKLAVLAEDYKLIPTRGRRRPLAQPNKPIQGSTAERKLDIGFVDNAEAGPDSRCHWSQILIPGELKNNPAADKASKAWLDLGRYAREVLAAQDARRFVLGFTICGPLMRIWEFDRLGGIASERFDINEDGLQFVSTVLGFLWMNEEQLGFDPTITMEDGQRRAMIKRNGQTEWLVLDKLMQRAPCVAGRATTCWEAHREGEPRIKFVIKDSWQYTEREEEGELLREATNGGVVNVARYYHHETVFVRGEIDEIRNNVRWGLNIKEATNYRPGRSEVSPGISAAGALQRGRSSAAGLKRSSNQTGAALPPSKRPCSASSTSTKANDSSALPNRVHRRVVLRDYGMPIYRASSRSALLSALEGCINGHESLHRAGILHRDISINNLMINEDNDNPSWPSFLIDLDLAIREKRDCTSGAKGKTGTRAFMAIGALLGEEHSFMHDLESFFWVLLWTCVHYHGPGQARVVPQFDKWNYVDMEELAKLKQGTVSDEDIFRNTAVGFFTKYYEPLMPWVNALRQMVFPGGRRWKSEDSALYARVKGVLKEARQDPRVLAEG